MIDENKSLSDLASDLIIYPQKLVNVKVKDKKEALKNPNLLKIISDLEKSLGNEGRILVRPSGTEALVRVMAEASTQEKCDDLVSQIVMVIESENLT
jgi:phosphoglucosamine mutase